MDIRTFIYKDLKGRVVMKWEMQTGATELW